MIRSRILHSTADKNQDLPVASDKNWKFYKYFSGRNNFLLTSLYKFATHFHSLRTSVASTNPNATHFCSNAASASSMHGVPTGVKGVWLDGE